MRSFFPIVLLAGLCLLMSPATLNAQSYGDDESYIPPELTETIIEEGLYTPPETSFDDEYPCVQLPPGFFDTPTTPPARNCCDVAQDLIAMNDAFDICEDELDLLYEAQELCQSGIDSMLAIEPQTQQIIDDVTAEGNNLSAILNEILIREDDQALRIQAIIDLNQQMLTCH